MTLPRVLRSSSVRGSLPSASLRLTPRPPFPGRPRAIPAKRMSQICRDRTGSLALPFEARDLVDALQRLSDVVEAVHQAVLDAGVDVEARHPARELDLLDLEVDRGLTLGHHCAHLLLRQYDRQQADLGAVGVEDVGEARRDDRIGRAREGKSVDLGGRRIIKKKKK